MEVKRLSILILTCFILSIILSPFVEMAGIDYSLADKSLLSNGCSNNIKDIEEVTFGENNIIGILYIPKEVPAPAIIFCNGKDTSIEEYKYYDYDKWPERRYINPETICKEDYAVLMVEFRGYDSSNGFFAFENAVEDVLDAIDFLEMRDDIQKDKIGIVGFSLGGSIAIKASAKDYRIKTCIAVSPTINFYDTSINWIIYRQNIPENVKYAIIDNKESLLSVLNSCNSFLIPCSSFLKPLKFLRASESCPDDLFLLSFYLNEMRVLSCNPEGLAILANPKISPADLSPILKDLEEYDLYTYIKEIYPRPLLIVSGTDDRLVPIDNVENLQKKLLKDETYRKNIEFLYYDGDHCILDEKTADSIIEFLDENLNQISY